ncbi:MAG: hypothetical protein H6807_13010 [Planctomycetes bacterium]|nr:hypothetical protein [Planctomycetota bacterium]
MSGSRRPSRIGAGACPPDHRRSRARPRADRPVVALPRRGGRGAAARIGLLAVLLLGLSCSSPPPAVDAPAAVVQAAADWDELLRWAPARFESLLLFRVPETARPGRRTRSESLWERFVCAGPLSEEVVPRRVLFAERGFAPQGFSGGRSIGARVYLYDQDVSLAFAAMVAGSDRPRRRLGGRELAAVGPEESGWWRFQATANILVVAEESVLDEVLAGAGSGLHARALAGGVDLGQETILDRRLTILRRFDPENAADGNSPFRAPFVGPDGTMSFQGFCLALEPSPELGLEILVRAQDQEAAFGWLALQLGGSEEAEAQAALSLRFEAIDRDHFRVRAVRNESCERPDVEGLVALGLMVLFGWNVLI